MTLKGLVHISQNCEPVRTVHNVADTLSLRFNGHFPGEPGLAGVY